jgi:two-component system, chemotaxis family, protein-glutamate methylesterase/glutaminase
VSVTPSESPLPPAASLVVIGASLGGLRAIGNLLAGLPPNFGLPLVIAQHRHKDSDGALRDALQDQTALPVYEAEDKQPIQAGCVYLAPADYHLLVELGSLALSTEAPVHHARPSIDVLFESAADAYGAAAVGVILTGASADGAHGLAVIKQRGGFAIVQEPATAECRVMPDAALQLIRPDIVSSLANITSILTRLNTTIVKIAS